MSEQAKTTPNRDESLADNQLLAELQRRSAAYRAGQTQARPAADVIAEAYQRQADGR